MNKIGTLRNTITRVCRFSLVGLTALACAGFPASPLEIGQLDLGAAYDVYVSRGTAYVSNNEGVAILDVRDLREPREVFTIQENAETGTVAGLHYSGDTLLIFGDRFNVYEVSEPDDPRSLSFYSARDFISAALIRENMAYLSYLSGGLEVVDFNDPANPTSIGYASSGGQVNDLAISGDVAFVANSSVGLEVVDITDPTSPQRITVVPGTEGAWDIHIDRDQLYLGCHLHGVRVIDIADPSAPSVVGRFDNGGETYGVHGLGERLYTADLQQGVEVLDISNPDDPHLIGSDGHYHPHDLYTDGVHLYLADQDRNFVVLPLDLD